ncbi:MAG TPA: hypothetical protein PKJ64_09055 [bacterium]|nr:hypothetical protein [bacterium]
MKASFKKILTVLVFSLIWSGCYTAVRQSGGYYSEFDHADAKQPEITQIQPSDEDSSDQDEEVTPSYDEDRDIYIQNYYGPEYPYPYGYWTPGWVNYRHPYYYGAGMYFGPRVRLAYVGTYWGYGYYDPFYDPYYYYDGWCYYPTGYGHHDNNPIHPSQQRTYGGRRVYTASSTPNLPGIVGVSVASSGGGTTQRIYRSGNRTSGESRIDQDRVRRNYRKYYGFETGDKAVNAEAGRKSRNANRETSTRNKETRETRQVRDNNSRNNGGERNARSGERNSGRSGRNEGRSGETRSSGKRSARN